MKLYKTRYEARKNNPSDVIVKVCGGYTAMTSDAYKIWKKQK